jgi:hypothetical protein
MSERKLFVVLVEEAHDETPFFQTFWAYGEHLGDALEKVRRAARSQGLCRPICREAGPYDLANLDCEVDRLETGDVFWSLGRSSFPPRTAFEIPQGVIPAAAQDGEAETLDSDDIRPGFRVTEEGDLFTVEANVDEPSLAALHEALLRAFEPFEVFWYQLQGDWEGELDAPELLYVNEELSSADRVLEHLHASRTDSIQNGFVTLTAFASLGATNVNLSDHKKLVVITRADEQKDKAVSLLESRGYQELSPFVSIDQRIHHWHFRHPQGRGREGLISHLLDTGFSLWLPGQ